ncbi:MAG TPA: peptide chain release factor N(5)-glutamine methyltransferase [Rhodothermales bacterium]|nr:peptide chain release factor N(5)-glutamine methyltransferase [Rhodothermales bacterium]
MRRASTSSANQATYAGLLRDVRERFRSGGIPDWSASAEWLTMDALDCTRTELFSRGDRLALPEQVERLEDFAHRRLRREPVQYILGYTEFCGLRLQVDHRVLIPRPETELLVESIVRVASSFDGQIRLLDVGTGSGCIALAAAAMIPGAEVWAVDSSDDALEVARSNADALRLEVHWSKVDILHERKANGPFTIVVSNPPYIPESDRDTIMPEVAAYEPQSALFVAGDPLTFYRTILACCEDTLAPGGYVYFEVNPDFALDIEALMRDRYAYGETGIELDLAKRRRIVWGRRHE